MSKAPWADEGLNPVPIQVDSELNYTHIAFTLALTTPGDQLADELRIYALQLGVRNPLRHEMVRFNILKAALAYQLQGVSLVEA